MLLDPDDRICPCKCCCFKYITMHVPVLNEMALLIVQGAFELISSQCPKAVAGMLDGMARRLSAASAARSNPNQ